MRQRQILFFFLKKDNRGRFYRVFLFLFFSFALWHVNANTVLAQEKGSASGKEESLTKENNVSEPSLLEETENAESSPEKSLEETNKEYDDFISVQINQKTAKRGYTFSLFNNQFKAAFQPGGVKDAGIIEFKKNPAFDYPQAPEGVERISDIYEFGVKDSNLFDASKPVVLEIFYASPSPRLKSVYYFDSIKKSWQELPSASNNKKQNVRTLIHLPYARLAVFASTKISEEGNASWYGYRKCDCAASRDYIKNTKLRVTNLNNDKSIIVTVNDYGPEKEVHPDRIIDLDKIAFAKIASVSSGVIPVKVEPVKKQNIFTASQVQEKKSVRKPFFEKLEANAALVVDAASGEILYEKNIDEPFPIASLTKLMSAEIFLESDPKWDNVVTYQNKLDDEIGSKLYVYDGETMLFRDVFTSALISSTNNAVNTARRALGITEEEFVNRMNKKAKSWGLKKTEFVEPTGLDERNVSTARELSVISQNAFKHPEVLEATTLKEYGFETINTKDKHRLKNTNKLVFSDLYITGGKTGYTEEAGYCLILKAKDLNGREVIAIVLGEKDSETRYQETETLLRWALKEL